MIFSAIPDKIIFNGQCEDGSELSDSEIDFTKLQSDYSKGLFFIILTT